MGDIHWCRNIVWLCFLSLRLACPRESHITCHHTVQVGLLVGGHTKTTLIITVFWPFEIVDILVLSVP